MTTALDDFRLPRDARPVRYNLVLRPDLAAATFDGELELELEVLEPTRALTLNACELEIERAAASAGWADDAPAEARPAAVAADAERERVTFTFAAPLERGRHTLAVAFRGVLNDKLCGFYRSTYDDDGGTHVIATTQFEETDARKAFPCYDEPDRKAVFAVTLEVPADATALSNTAPIAETDLGATRRVVFAPTIPMSTYLVAFVVGELECTDPVDVDGVALRVYTVPGKAHLARHALDAGAHALRFFASYFAIPYPGDKLDLVALPDFAAGAMENLGCVTFREAILLADPDGASRAELERLAEVVEHEIAHMWFGDLVTMGWWNGIWLNEAFATFMALCCQDDYRPEWQSFVSFSRSKAAAFGIDALHSTRPVEFPVHRPDEAAAMFDVLTYEKGASVLWMLEQYLGRDRFRAGVRRYLSVHRFSNTETSDLWDAIEAESPGVPVRALMDSWIFQGGFPLVSVEEHDGRVELSQEPFSYLPPPAEGASAIGDRWLVPVIASPLDGAGGDVRAVLDPGASLEVATPAVVNAGGSGFFRTDYDAATYAHLLERLGDLGGVERFNLVNDTWALALAGRADIRRLAHLVAALRDDRDPHVWSIVIGALALVDHLCADADRADLAAFVRRSLTPVLADIGWSGGDEQTPLLRSAVVAALGTFGRDDGVRARCTTLFREDRENGQIDADIAGAVYGVVAHGATTRELDELLARVRAPRNPNDYLRHLHALAQLQDPALAARVHALCLDELRSQDAPYLLGSMLRSRAIGHATWEFVTRHFDVLAGRFPDNAIHRMLDGVSALAEIGTDGEPVDADAVEAFVRARITGGRLRLVEQSLERLRINVALAKRLQRERPAFD